MEQDVSFEEMHRRLEEARSHAVDAAKNAAAVLIARDQRVDTLEAAVGRAVELLSDKRYEAALDTLRRAL